MTRPPIISLVERIDPGAAVMFAPWLIDGPQLMLASLRQIDMLTVLAALPGVYRHPRRLWYLGPAGGAMKPGGGAARAAGAGSGDGQRCAAAGETLSGLQLAGAALIMAGLYINVFGLRLVRPGMARG